MAELQLADHICAFVTGPDEVLDVMAHTTAAGLEAGDRVMLFTASLPPRAVRLGIEQRGIAVTPQSGQVQVLPARQAYLSAGHFEPARMLESLAGYIDQATSDGYRGLRVVGDMAWALAEPATFDELARYESRVNQLLMDGKALGICLYPQRDLPHDVLRQVSCAHPATTTGERGAGAGWVPLLRMRRTMAPYGLRLVGEADLGNREAVTAVLDALLAEQPDPRVPIRVDVSGLRFADAATATLLAQLALRAPAGVELAGVHTMLGTVFARLGLSRLPQLRMVHWAGAASRTGTEMVA